MNSEHQDSGIIGAFFGGCFTLIFLAFIFAVFAAFAEWIFSL